MGFYTNDARYIGQANAQEKHAFACVSAQLAQLARSMALGRDRRQLEIVCLRDRNPAHTVNCVSNAQILIICALLTESIPISTGLSVRIRKKLTSYHCFTPQMAQISPGAYSFVPL